MAAGLNDINDRIDAVFDAYILKIRRTGLGFGEYFAVERTKDRRGLGSAAVDTDYI